MQCDDNESVERIPHGNKTTLKMKKGMMIASISVEQNVGRLRWNSSVEETILNIKITMLDFFPDVFSG